jgi:hypothetical protein
VQASTCASGIPNSKFSATIVKSSAPGFTENISSADGAACTHCELHVGLPHEAAAASSAAAAHERMAAPATKDARADDPAVQPSSKASEQQWSSLRLALTKAAGPAPSRPEQAQLVRQVHRGVRQQAAAQHGGQVRAPHHARPAGQLPLPCRKARLASRSAAAQEEGRVRMQKAGQLGLGSEGAARGRQHARRGAAGQRAASGPASRRQ